MSSMCYAALDISTLRARRTSYMSVTLQLEFTFHHCSPAELREAFEAEAQERKKPRLLLTAAVPVGPDNVKSGYDVPAVARYNENFQVKV